MDKHWLQTFIEKNLWQIFVLGGGALLLASQVRANTEDISDIKAAMIGIANNQTQILLIQQRQETSDKSFEDLKTTMNNRFDDLEEKIEAR